MPFVSRIFIKTSLIFLLMGSSLGLVIMTTKFRPEWAWMYAYRSLHMNCMLFGYLLLFVFGTAIWMFPKVYLNNKYGNLNAFFGGYACYVVALTAQVFVNQSLFWIGPILIGTLSIMVELLKRLRPLAVDNYAK